MPMKVKKKWKRTRFHVRPMLPCAYCGTLLSYQNATVDHYVPLCLGGRDHPVNFRIACLKCNQDKADKLPRDADEMLFKEGVIYSGL